MPYFSAIGPNIFALPPCGSPTIANSLYLQGTLQPVLFSTIFCSALKISQSNFSCKLSSFILLQMGEDELLQFSHPGRHPTSYAWLVLTQAMKS